jgi:hypothetical protein
MSLVFVPEGAEPNDLLVMPLFISDPFDRPVVPEDWQLVIGVDGEALEREFDSGFYTAYWKRMTEDETIEVEILSDNLDAQIVGQILAFSPAFPYGSGSYGEGSYGEGESSGWLQPVGVFGELISEIEESEESGDPLGTWLVETTEALDIRSQDELLLVTTTNQENDTSEDVLFVSEPTIDFAPADEIDEVFTEVVTFRTAVATVLTGTTTDFLTHLGTLATPDTGVLMLLRLRGNDGDEQLPMTETNVLDAEKSDSEIFGIREGVSQELADSDVFDIFENAIPFIKEFSIVFNESRVVPGFLITLDGLLDFDQIEVFRRDPTGRYPDEIVRGLARQITSDDKLIVTDYEAPLNAILHYYIILESGEGVFTFGPVLPQPQPFIPTLNDAYGQGTAFMKPIDLPQIGQPLMIEEMNGWSRPANILARHHVLGRRNEVIITDVRGGREGDFSGHCILQMGQSSDVIEAALNPGATILLQNHNPTISGFPDMYVQIEDASFDRKTKMVRRGELDNPPVSEVVITFSCNYVQVDRPDPTGVEIPEFTWQVVYDTFITWEQVRQLRDTWLDVLARPVGPGEESIGSV